MEPPSDLERWNLDLKSSTLISNLGKQIFTCFVTVLFAWLPQFL